MVFHFFIHIDASLLLAADMGLTKTHAKQR